MQSEGVAHRVHPVEPVYMRPILMLEVWVDSGGCSLLAFTKCKHYFVILPVAFRRGLARRGDGSYSRHEAFTDGPLR